MKKILLVLSLAFASTAFAGVFDGATGSIGSELEYTKPNGNGVSNTSFQLSPGINFSKDNRFLGLDKIELLFEGGQDDAWHNGSKGNNTDTQIGLRIRRNFDIGYGFSGYMRGAVGRTMSNSTNQNWAYYEPGLKYTFTPEWSFTTAYRVVRDVDGQSAIDGTSTSINKLRLGPNWAVTKQDTIELRYVREFNAGSSSFLNWETKGYQANAYVFEYSHKF